MDYPVIADILRFVTLRAPQNIEHEKDIVHFIRDNRIQDTYLPVESHDAAQDTHQFQKSQTAQIIFNLVKNKVPQVNSNKDLLAGNRGIADDLKFRFSLDERTPIWIDEFVDVIRSHMVNFEKSRLRDELDAVVRKHFPSCGGISDYVEKIAQTNKEGIPIENGPSQFCMDLDQLFDQLYILYVCKRKYPLNLEYVLNGLRALHTIRFLNIENNNLERQERWLRGCLVSLLAWLKRLNSGGSLSSGSPKEQTDGPTTRCAVLKLTDNGRFPIPFVRLETKEDLATLFGATPSIHKLFSYLIGYYKPFNDLKPVGIGDLLVVRQFLKKYEAGEISHVENVLKGESKDHSFRRLDRTENTYYTEAEQVEQTQKELQTTSRYELKTEVSTTVQSDLSAQLQTSVSATYGMVSFAANAGVSYSTSKNESSRTACNFSKDIVDRAVSNIQKRVHEERTSKQIFEIEEIDKHGFSNVGGSGNIAGIYRWLDKHYIAQVYNYGKRLMFEFVIPEPAAFMKSVVERNQKMMAPPAPPIMPTAPDLPEGHVVKQEDVDKYAVQYHIDISGFEPEPRISRTISLACDIPAGTPGVTKSYTIDIPDGFCLASAKVVGHGGGVPNTLMTISIAGQEEEYRTTPVGNENYMEINTTFTDLEPVEKLLVMEVFAAGVCLGGFVLTAIVRPTPMGKAAWRNKAVGIIMNGYNTKMAEYKSEFTDYESKLQAYKASQDALAQGFNPKINEEIIKSELKKFCLSMITKQFASDAYQADDINFSAMSARSTGFDREGNRIPLVAGLDEKDKPITLENGFPAVEIDEARRKGVLIQFLEQAFEWPQITYLLYPYFWGNLPKWWFESQGYFNEPDPLYAKFLQAGSVRVLLAVHPAYETAVMHYLYTQEPWNGGEAPTINDPMYIPIYAELRNQQDDLNGAEPYGDPWDVVVPTSLIYLQSSDELPTFDTGDSGKTS
jgi:hypothetical protein